MKNSKIVGLGHYVPERVVTNQELEKYMDTSDEWIQERTGIQERRYVSHEQTVTSIGVEAAKEAIRNAGIDKSEIDFIIFSTIAPDYFFPGNGVLIQRELGLKGIGALDIRNACSGFIYGLAVADQFIKTGTYGTVLLVCSEIQSKLMDFADRSRSVSVIFADGAGAVVLKATDEKDKGILSTYLHADGNYAEELFMKDANKVFKEEGALDETMGIITSPHMNGNAVFKKAIVKLFSTINESLNNNNYTKEDIDLLITHQANLRISKNVQEKLRLPDEKVYNNIMRLGNTTSASIPIALSEAWSKGKLKDGDLLCLAAFGSGFAWGSALVKW